MHTRLNSQLGLVRPLVAALAAAAACGAWAQQQQQQQASPYYIGVTQAFTHDSNVYRVPNGGGDVYSSTGLIGGFDQPVGRQRFRAAANVRYNKYQDVTALDNTSYGVNAGWDWATIEELTGSINVDANQSLANFNGNATIPSTVRNIVKTDQISTNVRWGGERALNLLGSYAHSRVRYSDPASLSSESTGDTGSIGANYRIGPDLRAGAAFRVTRTRTPYGVLLVSNPTDPNNPANFGPNTGNSRNVDLTLDWRTSPQSNVTARVSYTRLTNSDATAQDFSGVTGALTANFAPTAKLTFNAAISRDAGTNSSFFNAPGAPTGSSAPATVSTLTQNSQTTDSYAIGAGYAATAKINLTAGAQYRRLKTVPTAGINTTEGNDDLTTTTLGAIYDFSRALQFACNLSHESRNVTGTVAYSYSANVVGCSAQLVLR